MCMRARSRSIYYTTAAATITTTFYIFVMICSRQPLLLYILYIAYCTPLCAHNRAFGRAHAHQVYEQRLTMIRGLFNGKFHSILRVVKFLLLLLHLLLGTFCFVGVGVCLYIFFYNFARVWHLIFSECISNYRHGFFIAMSVHRSIAPSNGDNC